MGCRTGTDARREQTTYLCQRPPAGTVAAAKVDGAHLRPLLMLLMLCVATEHDVGRLEVAVADLAPVALHQEVKDALHDVGSLMLTAGALGLEVVAQGAACAQLLHDVYLVLVLQDGTHRHDTCGKQTERYSDSFLVCAGKPCAQQERTSTVGEVAQTRPQATCCGLL